MTNSLLDFVMALVRDPDAAARYAADPSAAIAQAHLADVTTADVNGLIPMVAESMGGAIPVTGDGLAVDPNVWTSGAAAAAFDAFDVFETAIPDQGVHIVDAVIADLPIHESVDLDQLHIETPLLSDFDDAISRYEPADDSLPELTENGGWEHVTNHEHPGFDLF